MWRPSRTAVSTVRPAFRNLKLSVHSGSDKFSIYPAIHDRTMQRFDCGVHLKTAGTTWLEELIGLAEAGGEGLALAKESLFRGTTLIAKSSALHTRPSSTSIPPGCPRRQPSRAGLRSNT
jgi:hypothetical protein